MGPPGGAAGSRLCAAISARCARLCLGDSADVAQRSPTWHLCYASQLPSPQAHLRFEVNYCDGPDLIGPPPCSQLSHRTARIGPSDVDVTESKGRWGTSRCLAPTTTCKPTPPPLEIPSNATCTAHAYMRSRSAGPTKFDVFDGNCEDSSGRTE